MHTFLLEPVEAHRSSPLWRYSSLPPQRIHLRAANADQARDCASRTLWQSVRGLPGDDSPLSPWSGLCRCLVDDAKQVADGVIVTESGDEIPIDDC